MNNDGLSSLPNEEYCNTLIRNLLYNNSTFSPVFDDHFKEYIEKLLAEKKYDLVASEIEGKIKQELGDDVFEDSDDSWLDDDEEDDDDEDEFDDIDDDLEMEDECESHHDGVGLLGSLAVLGGVISSFDNKPKSIFSEKDLNRYELDEKEKDLVRRGLQNPWDFEEDDIDDDDDYYGEDDL